MGGLFGIVSNTDCVMDLFYGTDYHSHLGTIRGGLAVKNSIGFQRFIEDITNSQFAIVTVGKINETYHN